jgi:hypothetical protein
MTKTFRHKVYTQNAVHLHAMALHIASHTNARPTNSVSIDHILVICFFGRLGVWVPLHTPLNDIGPNASPFT